MTEIYTNYGPRSKRLSSVDSSHGELSYNNIELIPKGAEISHPHMFTFEKGDGEEGRARESHPQMQCFEDCRTISLPCQLTSQTPSSVVPPTCHRASDSGEIPAQPSKKPNVFHFMQGDVNTCSASANIAKSRVPRQQAFRTCKLSCKSHKEHGVLRCLKGMTPVVLYDEVQLAIVTLM